MTERPVTAETQRRPRVHLARAAAVLVVGGILAVLLAVATRTSTPTPPSANAPTTAQPSASQSQASQPTAPPASAPQSTGPASSVPSVPPGSTAAVPQTTSSTPTPAPQPSSIGLPAGRTLSGVAGGSTQQLQQFEQWRGKPVDVLVSYVGSQHWSGITNVQSEGLVDMGLPSTVHRVYSVPLIPSGDGATLSAGAGGEYDHYFVDLAQQLVKGGQADATIRLGWEMTGDWFAWNGQAHPGDFAAAFRQAVTAMRSVPGQAFTFDWTIAVGFADPAPMYPGDQYVDVVGADVYDLSYASGYSPQNHPAVWNELLTENYGLNWLATFAQQHGKRISIGEWGVTHRQDGHGGGDDPYFIQQMHAWIAAHDVAYEAYFNAVDPGVKATFALDNGEFPQAGAAYRQLFGGGNAG